MKTTLAILGIVIVLGLGWYFMKGTPNPEPVPTNTETQEASLPEITPIMHATAVVKWDDQIIYTDPTGGAEAFAGFPPAGIVLVTDIHGDHLSTSTLAVVMESNADLVVPEAVKNLLPENLAARARVLKNGESIDLKEFKITAIPMYNLPEASSTPHTKGRGNGYLIEKGEVSLYVAGDTSATPEMKALMGVDVALIPMNLPYTMSVDEAALGVLAFKPKKVYPYHYRGQDGLSDVNKFKELVNAEDPSIEVVLLNWYPSQTQ